MDRAAVAFWLSVYASVIATAVAALNFRRFRADQVDARLRDAERFGVKFRNSFGGPVGDNVHDQDEMKIDLVNGGDRPLREVRLVCYFAGERVEQILKSVPPGAKQVRVVMRVLNARVPLDRTPLVEAVVTDARGQVWWYDTDGRLRAYDSRARRAHEAASARLLSDERWPVLR